MWKNYLWEICKFNYSDKPTGDDTWEGTAHGHRGEGSGGAAEGRHDRRRPAKGCEAGGVAVVAVVVCLHGW